MTADNTSTAVVPAAAAAATAAVAVRDVAIKSIIAPPGNFESYMQKLLDDSATQIHDAEDRVGRAQADVDETAALVTALIDKAESVEDGGQQQRLARGRLQGARSLLTRALKAANRAKAFREALLAGYVPLPRMPAAKLSWVQELMPADVLDAMQEAKQAGLFEEFRLVTGGDATSDGFPRGRVGRRGRDPILVGMIGDEIFAIGWWR